MGLQETEGKAGVQKRRLIHEVFHYNGSAVTRYLGRVGVRQWHRGPRDWAGRGMGGKIHGAEELVPAYYFGNMDLCFF